MPALSQQQQKLFGLALSVKRGDTPRSEASEEVLKIVDSMSEKEIEDFAGTEHKGLPKKVEQKIREMVRKTMKERAISELELSKDDMDKLHSDGEVEVDGEKVTYEKSIEEAKFNRGDMVRVIDKPKYVLDKKTFAGKSGYVKNIMGRDVAVTFPNGRTILVDPKDLEMNPNESVNEGKKVFRINPGIGKAKYSISSHDGVKKHKDGSDFFDIEIFKSKVDLEKAIKNYKSKGFVEESVNEADVVGKTVFSDGKGKLVFGYYKDDDGVTLVDYKTWAKLNMKDVSKGDTNKDRVINAILRNQKQFNKKVEYNMWSKKTNPSFEEKMDWFIKNRWISNINKGGIRENVESVNEDKVSTTIVTKGNKLTHFPNSKKPEVISFLTKKGMKQVISKDKLKTNMDFYVESVNEGMVKVEVDLFKNYNQRRPDKTVPMKIDDKTTLSKLLNHTTFKAMKDKYDYIELHYGDKFLGSAMAGTDNWEFKKGRGLSDTSFRESVDEGASSEELRMAKNAIRNFAKHRRVPNEEAIYDLLRAVKTVEQEYKTKKK